MLGMAQDQGKSTITLPSSAAILKALDRTVDSANRRRLKNSLQYWCALSILFNCWHQDGKTLPPPIQSLSNNGRQFRIKLRPEWCELNDGYFATLYLPLPNSAAAQNVVLALSASAPKLTTTDAGVRVDIKNARGIRSFCRKVGLNHSTRVRELRNALQASSHWFTAQKLLLMYEWEPPHIRFAFGELRDGALKKGTRAKPKVPGRNRTIARMKRIARMERQRESRTIIAPAPTRDRAQQTTPATVDATSTRIAKMRASTDDGRGRYVDMWKLPDGTYAELHEVPVKWLPLLER
jgi:hypothetical protein